MPDGRTTGRDRRIADSAYSVDIDHRGRGRIDGAAARCSRIDRRDRAVAGSDGCVQERSCVEWPADCLRRVGVDGHLR